MEASCGGISVLVPVYNESRTVGIVLRRVLALGSLIKEVVVVDDGSSDGSADEIGKVAMQEPRVRFFKLERNTGKTAAIRLALDQASGDVVVVQDADLEYDPAEIPQLIDPIMQGQADVVYGTRFSVARPVRVLYFHHYLANVWLTFFSDLLTNRNMTDIETGSKAFRAGVIKPLRLTSSRFGLEVEITAMVTKTNARTYEVPISYHGRTYEEGKKIGAWDALCAFSYVLYYNLVQPRLPSGRNYVRTVNAFLESAAGNASPLRAADSA
jgi:glycosyltransferase involved in cell wall biosynthesis